MTDERRLQSRRDDHGNLLRHHRDRVRSRWLRDRHQGGAARLEDRDRGARASRRHLPQLGMHSHEGAAAFRRDFALCATCQGLRPPSRGQDQPRSCGRRAAFARRLEAPQRRRRLLDEEEQDRRDLGRGRDRRARQDHGRPLEEATDAARSSRSERDARLGQLRSQAHHHRDGRAPARPSGHRARREADLDLFRGDGAALDSEIPPRHGLGRDRHRIRFLLSRHGGGGDRGRAPAANPSGRGR